jgi:hypothetical protein
MPVVHHGANLRVVVRAARHLGADVRRFRRTGEIRFYHPSMGWMARVSGHRKDAPRLATGWVNDLAAKLGAHHG